MRFPSIIAALVLVTGLSCASREKESSRSVNAITATTADNIVQTIAAKSVSNKRISNETGVLKQVEDSGYPLATLTIESPDGKSTEEFTVNMEEVEGAQLPTLTEWVGKIVSFTYTSEPVNALLDLQVGGKSILKDNDVRIDADTKKIAGILKGADEETAGDLPGMITITTAANLTLRFPFFITKELVDANGSVVVGFYEERTENTITAIKLVSK
ncbi:hypothetical protein [Spirosoma aerophilum]